VSKILNALTVKAAPDTFVIFSSSIVDWGYQGIVAYTVVPVTVNPIDDLST
jgi:hypothetical protein